MSLLTVENVTHGFGARQILEMPHSGCSRASTSASSVPTERENQLSSIL